MIMCVLLCYPVSIHMSQLLSTGRPISSFPATFGGDRAISTKFLIHRVSAESTGGFSQK